jgi:hypothetical protein
MSVLKRAHIRHHTDRSDRVVTVSSIVLSDALAVGRRRACSSGVVRLLDFRPSH